MISEATLNALAPVQDILYADRVTLTPYPRSILATLMAASKSSAFACNDPKTSFIDKWLDDMKCDSLGNTEPVEADGVTNIATSLHSSTVEEAAEAIFQSTLNAVKFVRGKIIPDVNRLIATIDGCVNAAYRPVEEWEIIEGAFLPIWKTKIVSHIVSRADMGDGVLPNLRVNVDYPCVIPPASGNLFDYMMTGSKELDKAFRETLASINMNVEDLFMTIFGPVGSVGPIRHAVEMRNLALCQLLLVYMIEDNPWEGSGLTSSSWTSMCATLKAGLTKSIAIYRAMSESNKSTDMLVIDVDYKTHRIYVESDVYNDWLDESDANTPEHIIGLAMLHESVVYTKTSAAGKAEQAARAWASYHASKQQAVESNRLSLVRTAILSEIAVYLQTLNTEELSPGCSRASVIDCVADRMRNATLATIDNMPELIIDILCNDIFGHTGSYNLASRFNQVMSNETGLTNEDAELKVVIEYMTDFGSAQVLVGKM